MEKKFIGACIAILTSFTFYFIGGIVYTLNVDADKIFGLSPDSFYFLCQNQLPFTISLFLGIHCLNLYRLKDSKIYGVLYLLFQFYSFFCIYSVIDELFEKGTRFSKWEFYYAFVITLFTVIRLWALKRKHGTTK